MMQPAGQIVAIGLNHRTAPLEVRERFAIPSAEIGASLQELTGPGLIREAAILSTCNRVEIYAVSAQVQEAIGIITRLLGKRGGGACPSITFPPSPAAGGIRITEGASPEPGRKAGPGQDEGDPPCESAGPSLTLGKEFYVHEFPSCVRHLYEVASGLDSMVVGETEILGQVKESYRLAREAGKTGAVLNRLFQTAFSVAKDVRSRTGIGMGSVSVGSVVVDLAAQIFGDLAECRVLLIGAGEMSEITARALRNRGVHSLMVTNRSNERAVAMAGRLGGESLPWHNFYEVCEQVNIVISSTSSELPVITREKLAPVIEKRRGRPLFLIDIAVPRDIERGVSQLEGVYLYDIDDLQVIADQNLAFRQKEIATCKQIIREHEDKFMVWFGKRLAGFEPRVSGFESSSPLSVG